MVSATGQLARDRPGQSGARQPHAEAASAWHGSGAKGHPPTSSRHRRQLSGGRCRSPAGWWPAPRQPPSAGSRGTISAGHACIGHARPLKPSPFHIQIPLSGRRMALQMCQAAATKLGSHLGAHYRAKLARVTAQHSAPPRASLAASRARLQQRQRDERLRQQRLQPRKGWLE